MKFFTLVFIFLLSTSFAFTQQINIRVKNLNEGKATLHSLSGETSEFVDTLSAIKEESFQFDLDAMHSGFYRLSLINNTRINFIYDNEEIEIETDANHISDSL
ncbi:MAG: DUF4369 domain-containing protein, partial [Ignavibacteriaceae bacterium]|nr:DUF4369 domain-containing protein [Ignavibacteriaceae bacterium]